MTTPFNPGDKVVAYCRFSEGDNQGLKNTSTDEQEAEIRRYCDEHHLTLVQVFADPFASGRSVAKREHYLEMLSFLLKKRKPDIQGVILWDYERYGRNYDRAQYDAAALRMKGYKLFSMQQPIVDNGPFSHVLESMYFASAQNQSDMISVDVKRALQSNFQKYKVIPRSNIPAGWVPVPVKMGYYSDGRERIGYRAEPDPKYSSRIWEAVQMRLHGEKISVIRDFISGKFKTTAMVNNLFEKTLLYGSMTYGGTTIEDYCHPIIDRKTWDKLQMYIASKPKRRRSPGGGVYAQNRALLSGLLVCGVCGEKMHLDRRKAKGHVYETYYCNSYHIGIRKENIDDLIIEAAVDMLSGEKWKNAQEALIEGLQEQMENILTTTPILDEIAEIDRKLKRLSNAIAESDAVPKALMVKMTELEGKRDLLKQKSEMRLNVEKAYEVTDKLARITRQILTSEDSSVDEKREALQGFIYEIEVLPGLQVIVKHGLPGYEEVADQSRQKLERPSKTNLILATKLKIVKRV